MPIEELSRVGAGLTLGVFRQIKDDILNGRYRANETVPVETISAELGVSRSPIMAALRILAERGLVVIQPQVGCRVASFNADEIRDFFTIFATMEGSIAELAARRRSEDQLVRMRLSIDRLARARKDDNPSEAREQNRVFHEIMHEMANTRLVSEQSNRMWDLRDFIIETSEIMDLSSMSKHLDDEHHAIVQALDDRDEPTSNTLTQRHILGILDYIE